MTYHTSGLIQATTYNAYVAMVQSIYADTNAGSTTETTADFGYGQTWTPTVVAAGNNVTAAQWTDLFAKITACGTHQGTNVSPIPASVAQGDLIVAYNNYLSTQTLTDVVSRLVANRLNVAAGQVTLAAFGGMPAATTAWTTGLQFTFSVDFSTWDNARRFFNSGGSIVIAGSNPTGGAGTADLYWNQFFTDLGNLKFTWHDTIPANGYTAGSNVGFYELTTSDKLIYQTTHSTAVTHYSNNYMAVYARLNAAAGTNGRIDFTVKLIDNDTFATTKASTTFTISTLTSSGTVVYPGTKAYIAGAATTIASAAYPGVPLRLAVSPVTVSATVNGGAGTATSSSVTVTASGGTAPYSYAWSNESGTVTFSAATSASTTFSRVMTDGEIATGTAKVTVTDSTGGTPQVVYAPVNWSMNSNRANTSGP